MSGHELLVIAVAFFSAVVSGSLGMGGGILLLTVMAQFYPMQILIPLHGVVQLCSNLSRSALHISWIDRSCLLRFGAGTVLGGIAGGPALRVIPDGYYKILLGVVVLVLTFVPFSFVRKDFPLKWAGVGACISIIALYIGATGPLLAPFFLSESFNDKRKLVATKAACQTCIHSVKTIIWAGAGFSLAGYLPLLAFMVVAVVCGTWVGKEILSKMTDKIFRQMFLLLIVVLCLRLIFSGALTITQEFRTAFSS